MALAEEQLPRKLAAILLADVVAYSRLMGQDERGTLTQLKTLQTDLINPAIKSFRGRVVKLMGDGMLVEFDSVVDAVACALVMQEKIGSANHSKAEAERIEFRIGINLGDVIVDGDDIYGDGVNVTARLEGLAEAGGICISGAVYDALGSKLPVDCTSLGEQTVKNISRPVRAFSIKLAADAELPKPGVTRKLKLQKYSLAIIALLIVAMAGSLLLFKSMTPKQQPESTERIAARLTDKPSIAVLPFSNIGTDASQQYFADGMTDDLITDLTQVSSLHVISRDSVFRYRGDSVNIAQVAHDLGVKYILRGSVRRAEGQVRINAQLVDAVHGTQLWAQRYDGDIKDIFKVQDLFTSKIVTALSLKLTEAEQRILTRQDTNNIDAYEKFLRGEGQFFLYSHDGNQLAQKLFEEAIALDENFSRAYAMLAWTHVFEFMNGWTNTPEKSLQLAEEIATKAIEINESLPMAYYVRGLVHRERGDYVKALVEVQKTIDLDPNYANGRILLATLLYYAGRPKEGLQRIKQAIKLNPHHPYNYPFHLGQAYFVLGRYEEAIQAFEKGLATNPASERLRIWLAASLAQSGQIDDAKWEIEEVMMANPNFRLDRLRRVFPFSDPADLEHFMEGLSKAGL